MRNNRQHKKISKQAMDLLISHFGYQRDEFALESEMRGHFRKEWHFWGSPIHRCSEQDGYPAVCLLFMAAENSFISWTGERLVYYGPPMPGGDVELIRFVKAKIKAKGAA